ncbi:ATP-dependent protease [Treponema sp. R8-4-B8]
MPNAKPTPEPKATSKKKTVNAREKQSKPITSKQKDVPASKIYYCSFCGKSSDTRRRLIAGPNNVFICDECVEVCNAILLDEDKEFWTTRLIYLISGKIKHKIENVKDTDKEKPKKRVKKSNA